MMDCILLLVTGQNHMLSPLLSNPRAEQGRKVLVPQAVNNSEGR